LPWRRRLVSIRRTQESQIEARAKGALVGEYLNSRLGEIGVEPLREILDGGDDALQVRKASVQR
jgi:hypothetical protein